MLSSTALRRAFQRVPLSSRAYATAKAKTPYRFRFLLHTEEFAEMLEAKWADAHGDYSTQSDWNLGT